MSCYEIISTVFSGIALILSIISIVLQFARQKWLAVEIVKIKVTDGKMEWRLRLTNTKNRKHSICYAKVHIDNDKSYATNDSSLCEKNKLDNIYFQEGETKEITFFSKLATSKNISIEIFTDAKHTQVKKRQVQQYLKDKHILLIP